MKKQISIYLAGKIKKGHEDSNESYWTKEDLDQIEKKLKPISVSFLNPAVRSDDLSDQKSVFGRDMLQVFSSDIIFVDARDRRGLGVGAEMMWAKFHKIPVITYSPKNTHYNKDKTLVLDVKVENWTHPFIVGLSDVIVNSLQEATDWIMNSYLTASCSVKDASFIEDAMMHYKCTNFSQDEAMLDLCQKDKEVNVRVRKLLREKTFEDKEFVPI